jgi:hypothetical protein
MRTIMLLSIAALLIGCMDTDKIHQNRKDVNERAVDARLKETPLDGTCRLICINRSAHVCEAYVVTDECFEKLRVE